MCKKDVSRVEAKVCCNAKVEYRVVKSEFEQATAFQQAIIQPVSGAIHYGYEPQVLAPVHVLPLRPVEKCALLSTFLI